ncbi:MAG: hypothetical protein LBL41_02555 [Bifidobacteriaceae bacterium]|jgi:hypothetical protein|nr:hypothetical protein [Bifidobacteriaceae bacterium]
MLIMKRLLCIFALVSVLILSACSASEPVDTSANPYEAEFAEAREKATSDVQLEILKDGKITDAEIEEVVASYKACLNERGISFRMDSRYNPSFSGEHDTTAEVECTESTVGYLLTELYFKIKYNPTKVEENALYAACLVRRGLVPDDFTADDFKYYDDKTRIKSNGNIEFDDDGNMTGGTVTHDGKTYEMVQDETGNFVNPPDIPMPTETFLPGGVSMFDDRVSDCYTDPRPESDNTVIQR